MYIRVLCTIIYQSDDLALSASDMIRICELRRKSLTQRPDSDCTYQHNDLANDQSS